MEVLVPLTPILIFSLGFRCGTPAFLTAATRLHQRRVHLQNLRERHKLVDKLLTDHLLDDVLVIVVAQCSAQLVIVHVGLVLAQAPELGHFL